jgi:hypothetical protein
MEAKQLEAQKLHLETLSYCLETVSIGGDYEMHKSFQQRSFPHRIASRTDGHQKTFGKHPNIILKGKES